MNSSGKWFKCLTLPHVPLAEALSLFFLIFTALLVQGNVIGLSCTADYSYCTFATPAHQYNCTTSVGCSLVHVYDYVSSRVHVFVRAL